MADDGSRLLLLRGIFRLLSRCASLQSGSRLVALTEDDFLNEEEVVEAVVEIFLDPEFTIPILGCFRPFTWKIVARVVESLRILAKGQLADAMESDVGEGREFQFYFSSGWSLQLHEFAVLAFGRSLALAPFVSELIVNYFRFAPPPFAYLMRSSFTASEENARRVLNVIRLSYRLVELQPEVFSSLWDWSCVVDLHQWSSTVYTGEDQQLEILDIRWCCSQVLSVLLNVENRSSGKIPQTAEFGLGCFLRWEEFCRDISIEKAGWYMNGNTPEVVPPRDFKATSDRVLMGGSLVVPSLDDRSHAAMRGHDRQNQRETNTVPFILTPTMKRSFDMALLALSQEWPILLHGPIGSGKTAVIKEMARVAKNKAVIFIYVDDQMDVKTLLGSYVCSEIPGEFKWQPGSLTQAVCNGYWVVFEDIDRAPSEILSVIAPLLENHTLFIGSHGETIHAARGFQLLATVSSSTADLCNNIKGGASSSGHWRRISVEASSNEDMQDIIKKCYPSVQKLAPKLIETMDMVNSITFFEDVNPNFETRGSHGLFRKLSIRDLLKWCRRIINHNINIYGLALLPSEVRHIYQEAVDVFASSVAYRGNRLLLMKEIGKLWSIPESEVEYLELHKKPDIQTSKTELRVGRALLQTSREQLHRCGRHFANIGSSLRILEKIACAVKHNEPVLLVGETGTGKTTLVQNLATRLGRSLTVLNLSQQTDVADLLGGFKPVDSRSICIVLLKEFNELFARTFPVQENIKFLDRVRKYANEKRWNKLLNAFEKSVDAFTKPLSEMDESGGIRKRKRPLREGVVQSWESFSKRLDLAIKQCTSISSMSFSFVEGALVTALKNGSWILLDEVNLAPPETLQRLTGILEGETGTLCLAERGDVDYIHRHPDFRIFACMNPANDAGKRDLPFSIRSRFTEFFVDDQLSDEDLDLFVALRVEDMQLSEKPSVDLVKSISKFYKECRRQSEEKLFDGAGQKPQFSLRSLARALEYTRIALTKFSFEKALYDGFSMFFLTLLDTPSASIMHDLIMTVLLNGLGRVPPNVPFRFYSSIERVPEGVSDDIFSKSYVLTESIKRHLNSLARAAFIRRYPVLLQGPTSSGKTSLVRYLATVLGQKFVRINNHEHTDLQEYFGSYVTDTSGKLAFQEGILVEALRKGYWIVLDELNLAPSDVLEALNRLLDDNREIFLPELQETVKPHPDFMLFATQNPPITYGGRKVLSRAFRNRFLEIHVDEIPDDELSTILEHRCQMPKSYSIKMVNIMKDLQRHRQGSKIFAGKLGFITPRDLFRWADRFRKFGVELAKDGYYILAERLRDESEKEVVKDVLKKNLRKEIIKDSLYEPLASLESRGITSRPQLLENITWTHTMRRLYFLVERCYQMREPVLLVGETGSGKTTICQLLSALLGSHLHILNCHRYTETSDFLGGYFPVRERSQIATQFSFCVQNLKKLKIMHETLLVSCLSPDIGDAESTLDCLERITTSLLEETEVSNGSLSEDVRTLQQLKLEMVELRNKWKTLFAWKDGPLVQAMKNGDMFLVDEISLADDSVLERMNSVLEPERKLVLAEKGGTPVEEVTARGNFFLLATMNPGGDFGKKELSPALRNRFTEIWVPPPTDLDELRSIAEKRFCRPGLAYLVDPLLKFWEWFHQLQIGRVLTIRDLLSWIDFVNITEQELESGYAFLHGSFLALLDGLTLGTGISKPMAQQIRESCLIFLVKELETLCPGVLLQKHTEMGSYGWGNIKEANMLDKGKLHYLFGVDPFYIARGKEDLVREGFQLMAPTTARNAFRVLRAMQLTKPVLLEGSPGVGKTSLVVALANLSGHKVVRINLSEETDIMDLLGSDLPVDDELGVRFAWSDGILLQAIKNGSWVLLDELNLAPQSVLEGLNAILDHRAEVYIPELGLTFKCPPSFRVFACQNPAYQGGGRKGLPKSFLNRFTKVYVEELSADDYLTICRSLYPSIEEPFLSKLIKFNNLLYEDTMVLSAFGQSGRPWEFNLRDVLRACQLIEGSPATSKFECFLGVVYLQRMRTIEDRKHVLELYEKVFGFRPVVSAFPKVQISENDLIVGEARVSRRRLHPSKALETQLHLLRGMRHSMEAVLHCVQQEWCCILVGPQASGKTSLIRLLAKLTGNALHEFSLSSGTDLSELLGCFEQYNALRRLSSAIMDIERCINEYCSYYFDACAEDLLFSKPDFIKKWLHFLAWKKLSSPSGDHSILENDGYINLLILIVAEVQNHRASFNLPVSWSCEELNSALKVVLDSQANHGSKSFSGKFEWVAGGLVKAVERGDWVVLDNANLCNPTVLDRLNSLLETHGAITINERGLVNGQPMVLHAHQGFRLFLTVDPSYGEVSRAMRNRGVEVFLLKPYWLDSELYPIHGQESIEIEEIKRFLVLSGIPCYKLINAMAGAHVYLQTECANLGFHISFLDISKWVFLYQKLLMNGGDNQNSLHLSMEYVYLSSFGSPAGKGIIMRAISLYLHDFSSKWVDPLFESSISLPGGWPSPLNLTELSWHSNEADIKMNCMYLQFLVSQYASYCTSRSMLDDHIKILPHSLSRNHLLSMLFPCTPDPANNFNLPNLDLNLVHDMILFAATWTIEQATLEQCDLYIMWFRYHASMFEALRLLLNSFGSALETLVAHQKWTHLIPFKKQINVDKTPTPTLSVNTVRLHASDKDFEYTNCCDQNTSGFLRLVFLSILQWNTERTNYLEVENSMLLTPDENTVPLRRFGCYILPVFDALKRLEEKVLETMAFSPSSVLLRHVYTNILDSHVSFWKLIRSSQSEHLFSCWYSLKKEVTRLYQQFPDEVEGLMVTGRKLDQTPLWSYQFSVSMLWKYGGHPVMPSSSDVYCAMQKLLVFCNKICLFGLPHESGENMVEAIASSKFEFRLLLLQGLSMLHLLISRSAECPNDTTHRLTDMHDVLVERFESEKNAVRLSLLSPTENIDANFVERMSQCCSMGANTISSKPVFESWRRMLSFPDSKSFYLDVHALYRLCPNLLEDSDIRDEVMHASTHLQRAVNFSLRYSSRPPGDFSPHQNILWILDGHSESYSEQFSSLVLEIWFRWHSSLWSYNNKKDLDCYNNYELERSIVPRIFIHPIVAATVEQMPPSEVPIRDYPFYLFQHRLSSGYLWRHGCPRKNLKTALTSIAWLFFKRILLAHRNSFEGSNFSAIMSLIHYDTNVCYKERKFECSEELVALVESSNHALLKSLVGSHVTPLFRCLCVASAQPDGSLYELGHAWFLIGGLRFRLLVLPNDLDPAMRYAHKLCRTSERISLVELETKVRQTCDFLVGGRLRDGNRLEKETLFGLRKKQEKLKKKVVYRPNPSKFKDFKSDCLSFLDDVTFSMDLAKELDSPSVQIINKIHNWQETSLCFIQRLSEDYAAYIDLVEPLQVAVYEMKLGLSMLVADALQKEFMSKINESVDMDRVWKMLRYLMTFPCIGEGSSRSSNSCVQPDADGCELMTEEDLCFLKKLCSTSKNIRASEAQATIYQIYLGRLAHSVNSSLILDAPSMKALDEIFYQFADLWIKMKVQAKTKIDDEAQTYKFKPYAMRIEHILKVDVSAIRKLDNDEAWASLWQDTLIDPEQTDEEIEKDDWSLIEVPVLKNVVQVHNQLFGSPRLVPSPRRGVVPNCDRMDLFRLSYGLGRKILEGLPPSLSSSSDEYLMLGHLFHTCLESSQPCRRSVHSDRPYNFYKDPNVPELTRIVKPISALYEWVLDLFREHPDQPVLQQIQKTLKMLIDIPLDSPLAEVLLLMQFLLGRFHSLEENAANIPSIAGKLQPIFSLVSDWLKVESDLWPGLLDDVEQQYESAAARLWFPLYLIIYRSSSELSDGDFVSNINVLEEFMETSNVGEFRRRLELLLAFYGQTGSEIRLEAFCDDTFRSYLAKSSQILYNIFGYYAQYLPLISSYINSVKTSVKSELEELSKLTKWEYRNYYALMDTSKRTRQKLHKIVEKFNNMLQQPILIVINQEVTKLGINFPAVCGSAHDDIFGSNLLGMIDVDELVNSNRFFWGNKWLTSTLSVLEDLKSVMIPKLNVVESFKEQDGFAEWLVIYIDRLEDIFQSVLENSLNSLEIPYERTLQLLLDIYMSASELIELCKQKTYNVKKRRSFGTLLKVLERSGLSKHKVDHDSRNWFVQPAFEAQHFLQPEEFSNKSSCFFHHGVTSENMDYLWKTVNVYYQKNLAMMQRLNVARVKFHRDLTVEQVDCSTSFIRHLILIQQHHREIAYGLSSNLRSLINAMSAIRGHDIGAEINLSCRQHENFMCMRKQKPVLDHLYQTFKDSSLMLGTIKELHLSTCEEVNDEADGLLTVINKFIPLVKESKVLLDKHLLYDDNVIAPDFVHPFIVTKPMESLLIQNLDLLNEIEKAIQMVSDANSGDESGRQCFLNQLLSITHKGAEIQTEYKLDVGAQFELQCECSGDTEFVQNLKKLYAAFVEPFEEVMNAAVAAFESLREKSAISDESLTGNVSKLHHLFQQRVDHLNFSRGLDALRCCISSAGDLLNYAGCKIPDLCTFVEVCLKNLFALLDTIVCAGERILFEFLIFHRSVVDSTFTLANVFLSIYSEGFGVTESDQVEDSSGAKCLDASGTGMGEGEGRTDVSNQIEDEDQLVGASEKQKDNDPVDNAANSNAEGIEMEQDFDGETFSLSDDSVEHESDVDDDDVNIESAMGKTGDHGERVDEMLWDKDEDASVDVSKERYEKGPSIKETDDANKELGAKEDTSLMDGDLVNEDLKELGQDADPATDNSDEIQEDKSREKDGETAEVADSDVSDVNHNPEDAETGENDASNATEEVDLPGVENFERSDGVDCEDEEMAEADSSELNSNPSNENGNGPLEDHQVEASEKEADNNNVLEQLSGTNQLLHSTDLPDAMNGDNALYPNQAPKSQSMNGGDPENMSIDLPHDDASKGENFASYASKDGNLTASQKPHRSSDAGSIPPMNKIQPNPLRNIGDALKEWKDRVRMVSDSLENEMDLPSDIADEDADEFRFASEFDNSVSQALGAATSEQIDEHINLKDSSLLKENFDAEMNESRVSDIEQKYLPAPNVMPPSRLAKEICKNIPEPEGIDTHFDENNIPDVDKLPNSDPRDVVRLRDVDFTDIPQIDNCPVSYSDLRKMREDVAEMSCDVLNNANKLWAKYERITGTLSQELAEQLRLVMEPTLASKLQGDYRTGKRINMKKVIPYIASHFRKDKIWLRRTRPSKRDYQVVVAIDDSRSMAESQCSHMAIEALVTVCRAMSQLEVGQLAVASFGEKGNIKLLQDFEQPFTAEAGVGMISKLTFKQDNSILDEPMVDLLNYLNNVLDAAVVNARLPSGQNPLQQLILIIADGRFHEKENLRRRVRDALSKKRMIAFLIVDSPNESIMDVQSVSFTNGTPTFSKYLDNFPFPYYILLSNIEALPRTFSDLLRQWFELMQTVGD